jgi:broad specificity phosphatase PhoE
MMVIFHAFRKALLRLLMYVTTPLGRAVQAWIMSRPAQVVIIRHGKSLRNKLKGGVTYFLDEEVRDISARTPDHDIPLVDEGWEQARKTGIRLRQLFGIPHYLYHSGYLRTRQTMEGILEAFSEKERERIRIRTNLLIRERDTGFAYDMIEREARESFPWLKEYWKTFGPLMARPPGGESLADVIGRVYLFLNMLFRDRGGMRIFVVTHGGTIRCLRYLLERQTIQEFNDQKPEDRPRNCGVTVYEFCPREGRLVLKDYNQVFWTK